MEEINNTNLEDLVEVQNTSKKINKKNIIKYVGSAILCASITASLALAAMSDHIFKVDHCNELCSISKAYLTMGLTDAAGNHQVNAIKKRTGWDDTYYATSYYAIPEDYEYIMIEGKIFGIKESVVMYTPLYKDGIYYIPEGYVLTNIEGQIFGVKDSTDVVEPRLVNEPAVIICSGDLYHNIDNGPIIKLER